ncbi:MAG: hypothetical protein HW375_2058 [Anaerolineales bacterium]|nr:hypothetical protein [Anaerolineales bacterium]
MTAGVDRSALDFRRARLHSFFNQVRGALSGQPRRLLAFDEVREKLHLGGPVYRGLQTVPLDRIIGSVNRYRDFDRLFLPTQSHTEDRWRRINRAWYEEVDLPPVMLYKVGEVFFVVDGNHRVSVARDRGQAFIDAEVREVESRVAVTADIRPDDLALLGERVEFLERTQLDRLYPEAGIQPTVLGGYERLLEHIAVHRYFMGIDQGRPIPEKEAVRHWYETLYLPVVEVVARSEILEELPGRTGADFYLWTMDHLHFLNSQESGAPSAPGDAAQHLIETMRDD